MRIYDETFTKSKKLEGWIYSMALSPDKKILAVGTRTDIVLLDYVTLELIYEFKDAHFDQINSLSFNYTGNIIASGSKDKFIRLWDIIEKKEIKYFVIDNCIESIAFNSNNNLLASCSNGIYYKLADVWDVNNKKHFKKYNTDADNMYFICFSPNGNYLAVAASFYLKIFNVDTGELIHSLRPRGDDSGEIKSISFSPDGNRVAIGVYRPAFSQYDTKGERIIIWDVNKGEQLLTIYPNTFFGSIKIAFNQNGNIIIGGSIDINIFDSFTGRLIGSIEQKKVLNDYSGITSLLLNNDEIIFSYNDGRIKFGDIKSIINEYEAYLDNLLKNKEKNKINDLILEKKSKKINLIIKICKIIIVVISIILSIFLFNENSLGLGIIVLIISMIIISNIDRFFKIKK